MNKKLFKSFLCLFLFSLIFSSCNEKDEPHFELDKTILVFESEGGSQDITVSSNGTWTISNNADWITVSPQSGNGNTTVIVNVSENGVFEARETTLTFSAETQIVTVEVTQKSRIPRGIAINGVDWATRNVDAPGTFVENPESLGMFYQWGRNIGWSSTDPMINSNGGTEWDSSFYTGDTWTRANDPCPQGWRVPTREEIQTLGDANNVTSEWASVNGINGRTFTDTNTNNTIFFPAVGWRNNFTDGALTLTDANGVYWSSTFNDTSVAWLLTFSRDRGVIAGNYASFRVRGFSVRCVSE